MDCGHGKDQTLEFNISAAPISQSNADQIGQGYCANLFDPDAFERWLKELDATNFTESEKQVFLDTIAFYFDILLRIEFGLDPVQQVWGQGLETSGNLEPPEVKSPHSITDEFTPRAGK